MKAAVLAAAGSPLDICDVPVPTAANGQLLVQLEASGVCHTDVHVWQGHVKPRQQPTPFVLGHEGVGRVVAVGPGVTGWQLGDRVGAGWLHTACGGCDECSSGHESFCQNQRAHGFDVPGSFAEFMVCDAAFAATLPDGDPCQLAPLLCAGLTAHGALSRAALRAGETICIFGAGGLGLYSVQLAQRMGAQVIVVDPDPAKRNIARRLGANSCLDPASEDFLAQITAARPHVCINFAPTTATWHAMTLAIRPRGRIIAAAMVSAPVPLNQEWLTGTGVSITGTSVGTRQQMRELLAIHSQSPLHCDVKKISLDHIPAALDLLSQGKSGVGRFCLEFN